MITRTLLLLLVAVGCARLAGAEERVALTDAEPASATAVRPYPERAVDGARLTYLQETPVMFLSGTPEELGRQQAQLVGDVINPMLTLPRDVVAHHGYAQIWPLVTAMSRILVNNAPPQYQREINSLIEAGHLNRDGIYVGNSLVELRRMGGCSAFVVMPERSQTGELLFGRNFDFPAFGVLDTYHCLMIVQPEGKHGFASIGYPGMIGVISGMNDAGLSVATLDVYHSADGAPIFDATGVPLAMTYRRILEECTTVAEAEALLKSVKRTTYMNLAVADAEQAVVFEITPQTVGVRKPQNALLGCTNHFQLDGLCTHESCQRIDTLNALNRRTQTFSISDVQAALHRVNQGDMTLQTMIFEPKSQRLRIAMGGPGPVSNHPLKVFDVGALMATGIRPEKVAR
ncbi:MAG: linear amide C-N hydrolase [Planctomycetaceae bacterium]|nr:linear amide C-N hydrolase [Planctomycetaceae bacterium]